MKAAVKEKVTAAFFAIKTFEEKAEEELPVRCGKWPPYPKCGPPARQGWLQAKSINRKVPAFERRKPRQPRGGRIAL